MKAYKYAITYASGKIHLAIATNAILALRRVYKVYGEHPRDFVAIKTVSN